MRFSPQVAFAFLLLPLVVALGSWQAAAQEARRAPGPGGKADQELEAWRPGAAVEEEIRKAVAERWGVDPSLVVLRWTPPLQPLGWPAAGRVELAGSGKGGWWVVALRPSSGSPGESRSLSVRAGVRGWRWVAARPLARGETLQEGDWFAEETVVWGPPAPPGEPPRGGWVVERALARGEPLEPPAVRPPWLVVAGGKVEVVWTHGPITLRVPGRAEGSGALGERVRVRTEGGNRLEGKVGGPGVVLVSGGGTE